jgi:beta-glucanase (GH16 family)
MHIFFKIVLFAGVFTNIQQCSIPKKTSTEPSRKLVWVDEFDRPGLPDSTKWSYDLGTGCPNVCGWGNNELQYYTRNRLENARIENGLLLIEAHREKWEDRNYTSARLVSKKKGDWKYGRIEARIKCPVGRGTWPAFWMLSTDWAYGGWPRSGEIDIMEHVGYLRDSVYGSIHTETFNHLKHTQSTGGFYLPDTESNFHVYAIEWHSDRIDFFVDDVKYHSFKNVQKTPDEWPFDQPFHAILNLAVGGNWGGKYGVDEKIWPRRMEVDYVRIYDLGTGF